MEWVAEPRPILLESDVIQDRIVQIFNASSFVSLGGTNISLDQTFEGCLDELVTKTVPFYTGFLLKTATKKWQRKG